MLNELLDRKVFLLGTRCAEIALLMPWALRCKGFEGGHTQRGPQHVRLPVSRAKSAFDLLNSQDFDLFSRGQVRNGLEKPLTWKPDG